MRAVRLSGVAGAAPAAGRRARQLGPPPRPAGAASGSRLISLPLASIFTMYGTRSFSVTDMSTPFMPPSGVFSARITNPALQPPTHLTLAYICVS